MVRTALDTNILSAIWSSEPIHPKLSLALKTVKDEGELLISPVVYAELLAHPRVDEAYIRYYLSKTGIAIDFHIDPVTWTDVGHRYAAYATRRRNSGGSEPKRFLADFLVGSHALLQADRLMTTDVGRYRTDFPELALYPLT